MAFLTVRTLPKPIGRWDFFPQRAFGTNAPEMPVVGSNTWNQMLKNMATCKTQPPLSKREISSMQRLIHVEKDVSEIKEMMEKVMQSNKETYSVVHKMLKQMARQ